MKILYAVQGTGNGHVSRAREIIPHLQNHGEVDVVISGTQSQVELPIEPKYRRKGFTFVLGKHGGIDLLKSLRCVSFTEFIRDIKTLPVHAYDLVISDFEPVSAWACQLQGKECIALGHQSSFFSSKTPRPHKKNIFGELALKYFAPAAHHFGIHVQPFDVHIYTPVIRSEVRNGKVSNLGHITVYLPAYADEYLMQFFEKFPKTQWHIFSRESKKSYSQKNVHVFPVENEKFIESLCSSDGLLTSAGFEGPTEALFLKKKLVVIPQHLQYEQYCNAAAFKKLGVMVVEKADKNFDEHLKIWLEEGKHIPVDFPDNAGDIVREVVEFFRDRVEKKNEAATPLK